MAASAQRQQDAQRKSKADAEDRQDQRYRQPAPLLGAHRRQAQAATHQPVGHHDACHPDHGEQGAPEPADARDHQHRDQDADHQRRSPLLIEGIDPEHHEAEFFPDDCPAGALASHRIAGGQRLRAPDRLEDQPVEGRRHDPGQHGKRQHGQDAVGRGREKIFFEPRQRPARAGGRWARGAVVGAGVGAEGVGHGVSARSAARGCCTSS